jgi:hypothetical protein
VKHGLPVPNRSLVFGMVRSARPRRPQVLGTDKDADMQIFENSTATPHPLSLQFLSRRHLSFVVLCSHASITLSPKDCVTTVPQTHRKQPARIKVSALPLVSHHR